MKKHTDISFYALTKIPTASFTFSITECSLYVPHWIRKRGIHSDIWEQSNSNIHQSHEPLLKKSSSWSTPSLLIRKLRWIVPQSASLNFPFSNIQHKLLDFREHVAYMRLNIWSWLSFGVTEVYLGVDFLIISGHKLFGWVRARELVSERGLITIPGFYETDKGRGSEQLWRNTRTNRAKELLAQKGEENMGEKKNNNNNRCLLPPFTNLCRMCLSCLTLFILISVLLLFQSSPLTGVKTHRKLLPQWDFSHIFHSLGICAFAGDAPLCEPRTSPHTNSLTNQPPDTLFSRHS